MKEPAREREEEVPVAWQAIHIVRADSREHRSEAERGHHESKEGHLS